MIIAPLVFATLVSSIAQMGDTAVMGRVGAKAFTPACDNPKRMRLGQRNNPLPSDRPSNESAVLEAHPDTSAHKAANGIIDRNCRWEIQSGAGRVRDHRRLPIEEIVHVEEQGRVASAVRVASAKCP